MAAKKCGDFCFQKAMKTKALVFDFNETHITTIQDLPQGCFHTHATEFLNFGEPLLFYPRGVKENLRKKDLVAAWMRENLIYVDSYAFQILESMMPEKCKPYKKTYHQVIDWLKKNNPMDFDLSKKQPFYEYKLKRFVAFTALGFLRHRVISPNFYQSYSIMLWTKRQPICIIVYNLEEFIYFLIDRTTFHFTCVKGSDAKTELIELKLKFQLGDLKMFPVK